MVGYKVDMDMGEFEMNTYMVWYRMDMDLVRYEMDMDIGDAAACISFIQWRRAAHNTAIIST